MAAHDSRSTRALSTAAAWVAACVLCAGAVVSGPRSGLATLEAQVGCVVTTDHGEIEGQDFGASCAFLGIPYAASTANANRWKAPQPVAPWTSRLRTTTPPANCPSVGSATASEDCLKLNVWVAKSSMAANVPVLVWLHTGSFVASSANNASHNGRRLAEETGAIVVAPNYRLGPFGFLVHSALVGEDPTHFAGNYGLMDQRAALIWVQNNIAAFGGDPGRVTLAGTSAGADSVGLHMVSPASGGLFHRAIIESGTPTIRWPSLAEVLPRGDAFAAALACTAPASVLSCMRGKTQAAVLQALPLGSQQVTEPANRAFWGPVVDGVEIPDQPRWLFASGLFHRVPLLVGTNRDEGWNFVLRSFQSGPTADEYANWIDSEFGAYAPAIGAAYPVSAFGSPTAAMSAATGDAQFVCETRRLARLVEREGLAVYQYSYDYEIDALAQDRVIHGVESNIVFGNDYVPAQFVPHVLDAADKALHQVMAGYWTRFMARGIPNTDDPAVVHWPAFKHPTGRGRGSDKYLVFNVTVSEGLRLRESQCDLFEPLFLRTVLGEVPASAP